MPRIIGPVSSTGATLVEDFRFTRNLTGRQVKVTIPGPMTIIDSTKDDYYHNDAHLAADLAAAIREEVVVLAEAGCEVIQFDEPSFARYPEAVHDYGIKALEACFDGAPGVETAVHICRGYPIEGYEKAEVESYRLIAPALARSKIDQVSIEGSHGATDPTLVKLFGDKTVIFGSVNVGDPTVESVSDIESQIRGVLEHIHPRNLAVGPDCGMVLLEPEVALAKLTNLVEAARRVRETI